MDSSLGPASGFATSQLARQVVCLLVGVWQGCLFHLGVVLLLLCTIAWPWNPSQSCCMGGGTGSSGIISMVRGHSPWRLPTFTLATGTSRTSPCTCYSKAAIGLSRLGEGCGSSQRDGAPMSLEVQEWGSIQLGCNGGHVGLWSIMHSAVCQMCFVDSGKWSLLRIGRQSLIYR